MIPGNHGSVAASLRGRFGSLPRLLAASEVDLAGLSVPQSVKELICLVRQIMSNVLRHELLDRPIFPTGDSVIAYLRGEMANLPRETFRVLFLDSANHLIDDLVMWEGTPSRVQIHPREVIRAALSLNAAGIIAVHNHPSGDPRPSRSDIEITQQLCRAASHFDLIVHDHLIVSHNGWCSLRAEGCMDATTQTGSRKTSERYNSA